MKRKHPGEDEEEFEEDIGENEGGVEINYVTRLMLFNEASTMLRRIAAGASAAISDKYVSTVLSIILKLSLAESARRAYEAYVRKYSSLLSMRVKYRTSVDFTFTGDVINDAESFEKQYNDLIFINPSQALDFAYEVLSIFLYATLSSKNEGW